MSGKVEIDYLMSPAAGERLSGLMDRARQDPEVAKLLRAMHQVVAGGKVEVRVARPGDAAEVAALDALVAEGVRRSNALNGAAGAYVSMVA